VRISGWVNPAVNPLASFSILVVNNSVQVPYDVKTADPACSARFGTPSFVCFNCSQPSIFESAFLHSASQLANSRFEFNRQYNNRQQPQGKGAAAAGPGYW